MDEIILNLIQRPILYKDLEDPHNRATYFIEPTKVSHWIYSKYRDT